MSEFTADVDFSETGIPDGVAGADDEMPAFDSPLDAHADVTAEPAEEPEWNAPVTMTELSLNGTTEIRTDHNGDGFVDRVDIDVDNDGVADQTDTDYDGDGVLESTSFDFAGDGTADLSFHDTDGDGIQETILTDTDDNGVMDTAEIDADNDGNTDFTLRDTDGDGDADEMTTALPDGVAIDPYVKG
ncbi:hypothetical protein ACIA8K_19155 [Catenuloplanes sp. NPDC051500]|uniref:hypothetical protein n=1 Tax=Catenuloplanes sp. NPDC051500 TaxID=3363959 RepID=UPI0037B7A1A5